MREAVQRVQRQPVLLDRFLNDAIEVDVDCRLQTAKQVVIGGIMEHVSSKPVSTPGDSGCSLPPYSLSKKCKTKSAPKPAPWR
jgi:carbamoyl-phosphate synthase large subunit